MEDASALMERIGRVSPYMVVFVDVAEEVAFDRGSRTED
jgi:hypothetical protein